MVVPQRCSPDTPVGHQRLDQNPEPSGVIMFDGVTQLVHDHIVGKLDRQPYKPPIEVQIPETRTAAPDAAVVLDTDTTHHERPDTLPVRDARGNERACVFAMPYILSPAGNGSAPSYGAEDPDERTHRKNA